MVGTLCQRAMLRQVTFHFPADTQIRYLERPARQGDIVRGLDGQRFVVLEATEEDGSDVATCVTPIVYARSMVLQARALRARATRLSRRAATTNRYARQLLGRL